MADTAAGISSSGGGGPPASSSSTYHAFLEGEAELRPNLEVICGAQVTRVVGDTPSDAILEDLARHYSFTVYHPTSTCAMGKVVDDRLRVEGVAQLRVADASVMPNVVSGNTNAASIMIGEKAAEMIARDQGIEISEFVGTH